MDILDPLSNTQKCKFVHCRNIEQILEENQSTTEV